MSYDVMVFSQSTAPTSRDELLSWAHQQMEWSEGHSYDDPAVTTPALRAWFMDMIETFPAMNGPQAVAEELMDDDHVTDYTIGSEVIYAGFRWSLAQEAYSRTVELARRHKVGFYDVSSDEGAVWIPDDGGLVRLE